ncbi:GntR family transcriptional regulator [Sediminispirochaeta bajacaliforniensis]|uniref:GntR family transcriptional regulator n=1 Tax=Sediminispirochaeta bajacaliforniensis TaxID=148 RepID=UPI000364A04E|nr:GntR family transcriptional regulator [Sediminispirochaeta bajacaliforniensis]
MAKKMTLKEQVHDKILDLIIQNRIPMHEFLKEGELATRFKVSKAPIREALIELCNENIIRNIPRSGYQIIQLTERDIHEATQFRLILEIEGLHLAAKNIHPDKMKQLKAMVEETNYIENQHFVDLQSWWENNTKFHVTLNSMSDNSLITDALNRTIHLLWRAIAQLFWDKPAEEYLSYNDHTHEDIYAALSEGEIEKAEQLLRHDIWSIKERFSFMR